MFLPINLNGAAFLHPPRAWFCVFMGCEINDEIAICFSNLLYFQ